METLNFGDLVDLRESWDDYGEIHIGYGACVDPSTLFIYGAQGSEECIIISPKIIFVSYQERSFFSPTPMLWNFRSTVGKKCFWPIS
jgi:hypothetical protein